MDMFNTVRDFLESYGLWTLLLFLIAKFVLGVLVAIQKNEFKWYYLGEVFKNDGVKFIALVVLVFVLGNDALSASAGALLLADYTAGITKNLAHLFPSLAERIPSSLREPARLRLGNAKNNT